MVAGQSGAGKSTQIPQFLLYDELPNLNASQIVCSQPRCIAAKSLSKRVSDELDVNLGEEVGYRTLLEEFAGPNTVLKYVTDRALLHEAMRDSLLRNYSCIILDEVNERTWPTDILMGWIKSVSVSLEVLG